ncbi:MAG: twin-arginine translocation signal domain-containing protein [Luteitalea sp.]|nr:twin-arginine translocation signal domain-containing protein [Luteitalea sp.]
MKGSNSTRLPSLSRRDFLRSSSAAVLTGALANAHPPSARAQGRSDLLRVGLIGCGGRGTGAAMQALSADPNVKLTAMGDAFEDRLEQSLRSLQGGKDVADKIDVPQERRFVGFDAYQHVIDSGVDVVLLAEPPHFRPRHLKAAIDAGKHVFAEKPVAVDAPGVRAVLAMCEEAKKKNLSVVSGLCLRYSYGFQETVKRIHDGAIGDIRALQANDYRGAIWVKPRQAGWSDMEWQMRNWYYFTWLSGDFNVEQHVHYLDVCAWLMNGEYPVSAIGMGGRQARTGPEYGNIYDHHSVVYEYANGTKLFSNCRQQEGCRNEISCYAMGSKGTAEVSERRLAIDAGKPWVYEGKKNNIYQTEHDELFANIRSGTPINNGDYMAKSTQLAIMGRMATHTGQLVTWEQAMGSPEDLTPAKYEWGDIPTPSVAIPGVTELS